MNGRGESFVYSTSDKTYTAQGGYHFRKNKLYMRYKIYYDSKEVAGIEPIVLGPFKSKSEKEITSVVLDSFKKTVLEIK